MSSSMLSPSNPEYLPGDSSVVARETLAETLQEALREVADSVMPVWPLQDFVAVNPYAGRVGQSFMDVQRDLKRYSDCDILMPLRYYAKQLESGELQASDIEQALQEIRADGFKVELPDSAADLMDQLLTAERESHRGSEASSPAAKESQRLQTFAEIYDYFNRSHWEQSIRQELSKHCASFYDEGQAIVGNPWRDLPLYQAWRMAARHDRAMELAGLQGFRQFVDTLPHTSEAALLHCLRELEVPAKLWQPFLMCLVHALPGWHAWARYQMQSQQAAGIERNDLQDLLAIRLAYELRLASMSGFMVSWESRAQQLRRHLERKQVSEQTTLRWVLLRASEVHFRRNFLRTLSHGVSTTSSPRPHLNFARSASPADTAGPAPQLAQLVFCMDVRSESLRRHLESTGNELATYGFAGFFGIPMEFVPLGSGRSQANVPVLAKPAFQVNEAPTDASESEQQKVVRRIARGAELRKAWKNLQVSATGCFPYVESMGWTYAFRLLQRSLRGLGRLTGGTPKPTNVGPTLSGLNRQGITTTAQTEMAEAFLRGVGIIDHFASLVVICGHETRTENNPLEASLQCGACGGHSGAPNARFATLLLNQPYIRQGLRERGIDIPDSTWFQAAVHNTVTDAIEFFDTDRIPPSHQAAFHALQERTTHAQALTQAERAEGQECFRNSLAWTRSQDWSETRPEWGLANNAALLLAPRRLSRGLDFQGRVFLHEYDVELDPNHELLEQLMTAPMVVAHWINMQYYASAVDPEHFGSGTKTLHNVVGRFGVVLGNGGDLRTGLSWESVSDGSQLRHQPLRLLVTIAASRAAIEKIIARHAMLRELLTNDWLHLVAIEEASYYRYTRQQAWQPCLEASPSSGKLASQSSSM